MKTLILSITAIFFISFGFGQELVQKVHQVKNLKHLKIDGFQDIYFEFAEETEIEIEYENVKKGSSKFNFSQQNKTVKVKLRQNKTTLPSKVIIRGNLDAIETVEVWGEGSVHFPSGWNEINLKSWKNHNSRDFYHEK